jgi:hypothetical protein
MTKLERLIRAAGGVFLGAGRHKYYQLGDVKISLHHGTRLCHSLETKIISQCRNAMRRKK